jgi:hypothetical protein
MYYEHSDRCSQPPRRGLQVGRGPSIPSMAQASIVCVSCSNDMACHHHPLSLSRHDSLFSLQNNCIQNDVTVQWKGMSRIADAVRLKIEGHIQPSRSVPLRYPPQKTDRYSWTDKRGNLRLFIINAVLLWMIPGATSASDYRESLAWLW